MKLAAILTKNEAPFMYLHIHEREKGQKSIYLIGKRLTLSLLVQALQHLCRSETRHGMTPRRIELLHG